MNSERRDYLAAFAIGALVGAAIALLLSGSGRQKQKRVKPAFRRFRKRGNRLRRVLRPTR